MNETRIELISPNLRRQLNSASETKLRQIAAAVCQEIIERVAISNPVITQALKQLNSFPPAEGCLQNQVQTFAEELDSAYLDLSDECENGRASREQVFTDFSKARAASAVAFALDSNPVIATSEAIYEAASAIDNSAVIISIAEKILSSS
jgi:hypothetical protein